jgi:MFS transporter, SET family, sugar efflux transporter
MRMSRFFTVARTILRQPGFAGLLASNFALGMAYSFVMPLMSIWGTLVVKMPPVVFSWFMTITAVSAIVLSTVLARWSDTHLTRRTILILGSLGGVLGYFGYAFVRDPIALTIIGSLALGVASVNFSQLFAHVRETFDGLNDKEIDTPLLISLVRVCFSVAWTAGPSIGSWVGERFGYESLFLSAAGLFVIFLLGVLRFVPHRPVSEHARKTVRASIASVLMRRDIQLTFVAFVLIFASHAMNMLNLPLRVKKELAGTPGDLGVIFGIAPLVEIPLMIWFGKLSARSWTMQIRLIRLGTLATVLYFAALTFAQAPWHIYPIQILSAISFAILTNVTIMFYQDLLPGQTGMATTLFTNSINVGNLVGYLGFGRLVETLGHQNLFPVSAALTAVSLALLMLYRHRASGHETA